MRFILVIAVLILAVVFAVQNSATVTMTLFLWPFDTSLAVIIVVCFAAGALTCLLVFAPYFYRRRGAMRKLQRRITELEAATASVTPRIPPA